MKKMIMYRCDPADHNQIKAFLTSKNISFQKFLDYHFSRLLNFSIGVAEKTEIREINRDLRKMRENNG